MGHHEPNEKATEEQRRKDTSPARRTKGLKTPRKERLDGGGGRKWGWGAKKPGCVRQEFDSLVKEKKPELQRKTKPCP